MDSVTNWYMQGYRFESCATLFAFCYTTIWLKTNNNKTPVTSAERNKSWQKRGGGMMLSEGKNVEAVVLDDVTVGG